MLRSWYAVHTFAGHENKVKNIIERRAKVEGQWDYKVFDILIPTEQELRTRAGKKTYVKKKVFPGYILIEMVLDDSTWTLVKSTSGVTGFVSSGNRPVPLTVKEVNQIMASLEQGKTTARIAYSKGDSIRVASGPFADFTGKIDEVDIEREKLRVLISIFGRDTPVELEFTQVEKL
ncbi:MAG: transcription termination/antitermination protein NusG [bacterium]|jgi:transcriptional antiterminator NusG